MKIFLPAGVVLGVLVETVPVPVVPAVGGVIVTIGPFIASLIVLIRGYLVPAEPGHEPWKSSVSIDQTIAPSKFFEETY